LQAYFQIKTNSKYEHSFAERMKVIRMNTLILVSGLLVMYRNSKRLAATNEEAFNWIILIKINFVSDDNVFLGFLIDWIKCFILNGQVINLFFDRKTDFLKSNLLLNNKIINLIK